MVFWSTLYLKLFKGLLHISQFRFTNLACSRYISVSTHDEKNSLLFTFLAVAINLARASDKPKLSLDDFFNYVDILTVEMSPDGHSVVINTERADWEQNNFRRDLWLYRDEAEGRWPNLRNRERTPSRNGLPTVAGSHSSPNARPRKVAISMRTLRKSR